VWCDPVPNAWPGSITMSMPSPSSGASQGGRTRRRRNRQLTSTGLWNAFQRSDQSSGISVVDTSTSASPAAACRSGSAGSSPGAP
jgi:hypothetical protein